MSVTSKPSLTSDLCETLRRLEGELLDASLRHDMGYLEPIFVEEFREFGSSGRVFDKEKLMEDLRNEPMYHITLDRFECTPLGPEAALVTYRSTRVSTPRNIVAHRSSVWVHRDGRWQMLFHQGTRA